MLVHICHVGGEYFSAHEPPLWRISSGLWKRVPHAGVEWYPANANFAGAMHFLAVQSFPALPNSSVSPFDIPFGARSNVAGGMAIPHNVRTGPQHHVFLVQEEDRFGRRALWKRHFRNWLNKKSVPEAPDTLTIVLYPPITPAPLWGRQPPPEAINLVETAHPRLHVYRANRPLLAGPFIPQQDNLLPIQHLLCDLIGRIADFDALHKQAAARNVTSLVAHRLKQGLNRTFPD